MKKAMIVLWLAIVIMVTGCGKTDKESQQKDKADIPNNEEILGKYVFQEDLKKDPQRYVKLESGGRFYYQEEVGEWKIVDDDKLLISGPFGGLPLSKLPILGKSLSKGVWRWKIKDKTTLIDAEGGIWVKQSTDEKRKLEWYNKQGRALESKDPNRMREALKEMQKADDAGEFSVDEYKRLRDKYK